MLVHQRDILTVIVAEVSRLSITTSASKLTKERRKKIRVFVIKMGQIKLFVHAEYQIEEDLPVLH